MLTTIRGQQLRDATVSRGKIDAAFEASLATIESNITQIFNTMSTDAERLAAIEAVNAAWQAADGSLQAMITSMVNATKAGAGLEANGTLDFGEGYNFLNNGNSSSLKAGLITLDAALKSEQDARVAAVNTLQSNLQAVIDSGATSTQAALAAETAARQAADTALQAAITAETAARTAADADLQTQLDNEITAREDLNTTLSQAIANEANARTAAVSAEATTRAAADTALQNAIDAEALARTNADAAHTAAIAQEVADRTAAVTAEAATRAAADAALDTRVQSLEDFTAETLTYAKRVTREAPAGAIDGINQDFTLANAPHAGTEEVFYNGQLLEPGVAADYTINGQVITLAFAPVGTDRVRVSYFR